LTEPKIRAQHIGIVGCSAEGAALYNRTVCAAGAALMGPYRHPEGSLHTPSFSAYVTARPRRLAGVAELMLASGNKLAHIGSKSLGRIRFSVKMPVARHDILTRFAGTPAGPLGGVFVLLGLGCSESADKSRPYAHQSPLFTDSRQRGLPSVLRIGELTTT
jgi:hypothetical protein